MKKIKKADVKKFLGDLKKEHEVFAPVDEDGVVEFKRLSKKDEPTLDYVNSVVSPKGFFLPMKEKILGFREANDKIELIDEHEVGGRVLFGIRPCDVNGLLVLDNVAREEYMDPYYLERRQKTILIALECVKPGVDCFCRVFGSGPGLEMGADLVYTDIGDYFLVRVGSDKGAKLLSGSDYFVEASDADEKKAAKLVDECAKKMSNVESSKLKLDLEKIRDKGSWCLNCYSCTFICPTCYCFDVVDRMNPKGCEGQRIRCWDSCMNPQFTLMAGNFNPRNKKVDRFVNRIRHKLEYMRDRYGVFGCVGCGRCVRECPSHISMLEIIQEGVR